MSKTILFTTLALFLVACGKQVMTTAECEQADWYAIGKRDASAGASYERIGEYATVCKSVKVVPNKDEYVRGYKEGADIYCTHDNGYQRGKQGGQPFEMCERGSDYNVGYNKGIKEYAEETERRQLETLTRPTTGAGFGAGPGGGQGY